MTNAVLVLYTRLNPINRQLEVLFATKHAEAKVGAGKLNGYGGCIDPGETPAQAAIRETNEEAGENFLVLEKDLKARGIITFYDHEIRPKWKVYIFVCDRFSGEPKESKEMLDPKWFDADQIPKLDILPADKLFMPKILSGKTVHNGWVIFKRNFSGVRGYGGF